MPHHTPAERNAGNAIVLAQIDMAKQAAAMLAKEGHLVIGVRLDGHRPCITLSASARLAALAGVGQGTYYAHGHDDMGHYRKGVLTAYRAVHVQWIERGQ